MSDALSPAERAEEAELVRTLAAEYTNVGADSAARIIEFSDADLVLLAGFVYPGQHAQPMLQRVAALRRPAQSESCSASRRNEQTAILAHSRRSNVSE